MKHPYLTNVSRAVPACDPTLAARYEQARLTRPGEDPEAEAVIREFARLVESLGEVATDRATYRWDRGIGGVVPQRHQKYAVEPDRTGCRKVTARAEGDPWPVRRHELVEV